MYTFSSGKMSISNTMYRHISPSLAGQFMLNDTYEKLPDDEMVGDLKG